MSDRVLLVSPPDDVFEDALRILLVDLNKEQSDLFSQSLLAKENLPNTVVYSWSILEDINWLFDKSLKSDIIVFNANSENQTLVGYFAGRKNSYYFGNLKSLQIINKSAIYDVYQCSELLERTFDNYGKT